MALVPDSSHASASGGGVTVVNYTQVTAGVTVTGTTAGAPTELLTSGTLTYAAVVTKIEFYCCDAGVTGANGFLVVGLYDDTTELGRMATIFEVPANSFDWPIYVVRYLTPSAGSHLYKIKAYKAGAALMNAGDGTGDNSSPMFVRITTGG